MQASPNLSRRPIYVAYTDQYRLELPTGHRFPQYKYELLREQLLHRGIVTPENLYAAPLLDEAIIRRTHSAAYWQSLKELALTPAEVRKIGLPLTERLVLRAHASASGTFQAAFCALEVGLGVNLGGGTHHAFFDRGEGYCLLNDVAISANYLLDNHFIKKALVVDLDVHQGNGTAALFQGRSEVFTFSMHCGDNYPLQKEKSDLDIELPRGMQDREYLAVLKAHLPGLIHRQKPDLIYYIAGADVLATDRLGKLALTPQGCSLRDAFVLDEAYKNAVPLVLVMGGGYSENLLHIIDVQTETLRLAFQRFD